MPATQAASKEIDAIIKAAEPWKGQKMAELRELILAAGSTISEDVKWKKPSKPEGVAVWVENGNLCHIDLLKSAVRLNFHKGAQIKDPKKLFNTRLDSSTVRAIDFGPQDIIDKAGIKALVQAAVKLNKA
ncbi:MAG: DUF1801 domain-containing protein [Anaerolineales bacterium]|nr:DUF1801 domain-containing protein [Anaerolineales bacterium]MBX3004227.1 DUF1801 domain-containing protein [Anaerolineales bacterium]MCW5839441.1 DUF1801 domain-containing protein [Anaerolineales bacterium]MCW5888271.1 DUF1801 domain-containing protein [Anaerolineales bacterium]